MARKASVRRELTADHRLICDGTGQRKEGVAPGGACCAYHPCRSGLGHTAIPIRTFRGHANRLRDTKPIDVERGPPRGEVQLLRLPLSPTSQATAALVLLGILTALFVTHVLRVTPVAALVYLGGYLAISLAITRMRAEFGLPVHDLFTGPLDMMVRIGGAQTLGRENVLGLGLLWWLERVQRSHPMPHGIEGLALGERRGLAGPRTLVALAIAIGVGVAAGFWATLLR